jgi:hypothetical protein
LTGDLVDGNPIELLEGQAFKIFATKEFVGDSNGVGCTVPNLLGAVNPGDSVYLANG